MGDVYTNRGDLLHNRWVMFTQTEEILLHNRWVMFTHVKRATVISNWVRERERERQQQDMNKYDQDTSRFRNLRNISSVFSLWIWKIIYVTDQNNQILLLKRQITNCNHFNRKAFHRLAFIYLVLKVTSLQQKCRKRQENLIQIYLHLFFRKEREKIKRWDNSRAHNTDGTLAARISQTLDTPGSLIEVGQPGRQVGWVARVGRHLC